MINVVIADDHHLVRQGIKAILEKTEDIQVIGEAEDGHEAVALVTSLEPDVILMDISMPNLNGIQAIAKIRTLNTKTKAVVLSMYSDAALVRQALQNGAKGYLLKRSVTAELIFAIRSAMNGGIYLSPLITNVIINDTLIGTSDYSNILERLSLREREVLQLIAEGNTNHDIAEKLVISVKTVEKHRSSLMEKLNIHDTPGLVRIAISSKLIMIDQ